MSTGSGNRPRRNSSRCQLGSEGFLVERHPGDHTHNLLRRHRRQLSCRFLFEDVVDDLDRLDKTLSHRLNKGVRSRSGVEMPRTEPPLLSSVSQALQAARVLRREASRISLAVPFVQETKFMSRSAAFCPNDYQGITPERRKQRVAADLALGSNDFKSRLPDHRNGPSLKRNLSGGRPCVLAARCVLGSQVHSSPGVVELKLEGRPVRLTSGLRPAFRGKENTRGPSPGRGHGRHKCGAALRACAQGPHARPRSDARAPLPAEHLERMHPVVLQEPRDAPEHA